MDLREFRAGSLDPRFAVQSDTRGVRTLALSGTALPPPPVVEGEGPPLAVEGESGGGEAAGGGAKGGRDKERAISSHGARIETSGKIGGPFERAEKPAFVDERLRIFDRLYAAYQERVENEFPHEPIEITLPDGKKIAGVSFETTPLDIAMGIAKSLAKQCVAARVTYSRRVMPPLAVVAADSDGDESEFDLSHLLTEAEVAASTKGETWDMTRPLEGDCQLQLLKFSDDEGRTVFWHSSAHVLGEALERAVGAKLTVGPPLADGFYYDSYCGAIGSLSDEDMDKVRAAATKICKENQPFQRVVMTKEEALSMFRENPFKQQLITAKVPDGGYTTAYRCGDLVDLCTGPHLPNTSRIGAFHVSRSSATTWLGESDTDVLARLYAVSFPTKKELSKHLKQLEAAKARDHRRIGVAQDLFFFDELSPGSCFFLPHGARVFGKLCAYIREIYSRRGFQEVITPNIYNLDLWRISGHAEHYKDDMFTFDVEGQSWGLKPMNCPAHCVMFRHTTRTHRELPLRFADFGALHRNEASGALSGLTRVRRFQQDDAHCFVRPSQISAEVHMALEFIEEVYGTLGFDYALELSTRPKKALGDVALWNKAEVMMKDALDKFGKPWKLNPGDGAFYGPKIDIKVFDALGRPHQCATVQLDFQLPQRFNLEYVAAEGEELFTDEIEPRSVRDIVPDDGPAASKGVSHVVGGKLRTSCGRPVMIHRAVLGSVERMMAVLTEHMGGRWPFWLSPRQVMVIPVGPDFHAYGRSVRDRLHDAGLYVDIEETGKSLGKKVREAQTIQYNFILVVGIKEMEEDSVNVRVRSESKPLGTVSVEDFVAAAQKHLAARSNDDLDLMRIINGEEVAAASAGAATGGGGGEAVA